MEEEWSYEDRNYQRLYDDDDDDDDEDDDEYYD
jgi:hypothetical protein